MKYATDVAKAASRGTSTAGEAEEQPHRQHQVPETAAQVKHCAAEPAIPDDAGAQTRIF